MNKEFTLQIPDSLYSKLEDKAKEQGISLETLCLFRLSSEVGEPLVHPDFYGSLDHQTLRAEVTKVIQSSLSSQEIRKRINQLEFQISRRYIR